MVKYATRLEESTLRRMWLDKSIRLAEIAAHFGVSDRKVRVDAGFYGLPARKKHRQNRAKKRDPTPEELDALCAQLRAKRAPSEERPKQWELPRFSYDGTNCTFSPM